MDFLSPSAFAMCGYDSSVVISGRSKERSDACRPWNPCRYANASQRLQNSAPLHSAARATAWITRVQPEYEDVT